MSLYEVSVVDSTEDKRVLQNMYCSDTYLEKVSKVYLPEAFESDELKAISRWVIEYYQKYSKAPKSDSRVWISEKLKAYTPEKRKDLVDVLAQIMQMEVNDSEASINLGVQFFQKAQIKNQIESVQMFMERNQFDKAVEAVSGISVPQVEESTQTDNPYFNEGRIDKYFSPEHLKPLFNIPYAFGSLVNPHLVRGGFVAFQGCAKSTKSFCMRYLAFVALQQNLKVYYADLGDSDGLDNTGFLIESMCGRTKNPYDCGPVTLRFGRCARGGSDCPSGRPADIKTETKYIPGCPSPCSSFLYAGDSISLPSVEPLKKEFFESRRAKFVEKGWLSEKNFQTTNWSAGEATIQKIEKELDELERKKEFVPDVIILDYADLLENQDPKLNPRDKNNANWKAIRALAHKRNCLIITATQAKISAYGKRNMSEADFSEDSRKFHHVTAFFAIDRTSEDSKENQVRISALRVRRGRIDFNKEVLVTNCLQRAQYHVHSYWVDKTDKSKSET